jgi:hypothetical protein
MASKRLPRPRDPLQLGKLIVDIATGQVEDQAPSKPAKGRAGGLKGGAARSASLDPQKRQEIARKAASARWAKKSS